MLTILKKTAGCLATIDEMEPGSWISVVDPTASELERLRELGIPDAFISSSLDVDERARTDRESGATLIILRVPYDAGEHADVRYRTVSMGIILFKETIVTISKVKINIVDHLLQNRSQIVSTVKRNRLILHILLSTAQNYLIYLRRIDSSIETVEFKLQRSLQNGEVLELLAYQKSLVYFTTGLKSNEVMMQRLQKSHLFEMYADDQDLLEDVLTENTQASEMTAISSNILNQMMGAYGTIISNNLNAVMKFLASATIVLSFPTIVASIYGMNVHLPGQNTPHMFYGVMAFSMALSVLVIMLFRKQNWM